MAITVKHKFVSAIPDAGDPTIVQPSNWNDDHQLTGTVPVANGGTGVSTSSGANSVVLRDSNANITTNCLFEGYLTQAASGTPIILTAASVQNFQITGSGGQTIRLPDATTLPNGALFTFNNNQSSGTIVVQNNSSTTIATINSGGYVTIVLLDNSTAAGSWDRHDSTPSNVSWSTNTLDYAGSITSATWNGNAVAINRGGTNATTASITSFNNITGYSASGATGTTSTNLVFSTAPTVTNPTLTGFVETVYAVTGTTPALSPTNGTIQTWTLSGASTPTAGTWTAGASLSLQITASTNTITWSSVAVTWIGGSAPTLSTTVTTNIELWKIGSTIYGALVGNA